MVKWKRLGAVGLGILTAFLLLIFGRWGDGVPAANFGGNFAIAQEATPSPAASPSPTASPSPSPSPSPTPQASPTPKPAPPPEPEPAVEPLPLSGSAYQDPRGQFEVGILQDYNVGFAGNSPLLEAPDGNLAYTVVAKPRESDRALPDSSLAQIAIETFERGEGFDPGTYQSVGAGEIRMPWTGSLKIGANTQPITGSILVRQVGDRILILLVSATQAGAENIDAAIAALSDTLQPL
ncbi:hypothetical protein [Lyngbya sp. CCY1209]|uniref:hypothetical protein n=1 Tax=Lyngbya sp. CCY1209 TaxID=2886103 RepID=UPI002D20C5E3|nr:hypothetical protein [Lyngbya sp. CCY1209]MEB3884377.1 hypothetical protein [Lyngbya sp. CCY1209]